MNEKLKQLYTLLEKMDWLSHAIEVINYDIETQAPKKGMENDARDITFLSNERFRIHSSDEFRKLVKELKKEQDSLDTYNQRLITLLDRELTREDHITSDFDKERTEDISPGSKQKKRMITPCSKIHLKRYTNFRRDMSNFRTTMIKTISTTPSSLIMNMVSRQRILIPSSMISKKESFRF